MESRSSNLESFNEELILSKTKASYQEREIERLGKELKDAIASKDRFDREAKRITYEFIELEKKFVRQEVYLTNARDEVHKYSSKEKKKHVIAILLAILASLLFLLSNILVGFGVNMLTSSSPNELGRTMIILGGSTYIIAAIITAVLTFIEGK